jgi:hypothetical protein
LQTCQLVWSDDRHYDDSDLGSRVGKAMMVVGVEKIDVEQKMVLNIGSRISRYINKARVFKVF